ncbi:MAG: 50S ribosomal protein L24 [Clostridiales bacterium]|nr:50S ribosomal protein L24 [Clostridiales bacterium]
MKLHVRTDDTVVVISGKDVGKKGKVLATDPSTGMVLVEGVNIVSRHQKPRRQGEAGGIIEREGYIRASKVMRVCPKCSKPTRLAHKIDADGNKTRVCKKCGANI